MCNNFSALSVIKNSRPFVISRSSFAGLGHFAGHWTGDVFSTWDDMKQSITGNKLLAIVLEFLLCIWNYFIFRYCTF